VHQICCHFPFSRSTIRVPKNTIFSPSWVPVIERLERDGKLWATFSRNDVALRNGSRVCDEAPTNAIRVATEQEQQAALAEEFGGDFTAQAYLEADPEEDLPAGEALTAPYADGLGAFALEAASEGHTLPAPEAEEPAGIAAAAGARPPAKRRRCTSCDRLGHRADNESCEKYAIYAEQLRKRKAAAAAAAAAASATASADAAAEDEE
jgi:hypothetical protein